MSRGHLFRNQKVVLNEKFLVKYFKICYILSIRKPMFFILNNFTFFILWISFISSILNIKYSKLWSVSLEHFIEFKPLIYEEWSRSRNVKNQKWQLGDSNFLWNIVWHIEGKLVAMMRNLYTWAKLFLKKN